MGNMQGIWLEDQQINFRADLPIPEPPAGEALVRVLLAGICATDLEMMRGYYPFTGVLGHEFVGEVVALAADNTDHTHLIGQRVVGEINAACGECEACQAGRPTHCEQRTVLGILNRNGAFAQYLTLPVENLHLVPPEVPDQVAVFTEPLAAALEIQQQMHILPTDRVLIIGAGRLGQLIAQTLALTGCDLTVVVRHTQQAEILGKWGIQTTREWEAAKRKVDIVIEATGSPAGFQLARQAVRARGAIVLKSTYKGNLEVNLSSVVVDEVQLIGSRCGPFPPALRLLSSQQVDPTPLINAQYRLEEAVDAFEHAAQSGVLKVVLHPPQL